ncbi:tRNA 2'-phosphotransferase 1-like isoform X2 [Dioscorea cayenensis subsp. rotundata]|uniref:2'-phosphotransferase n=1 Tax=Dioscorea cayennensis subsp. rotundata TaxID=55577 RepID=A0AB40BI73_DIOCR|nr:tRNA 2'-phosphotransferase 1-like isoform X2 [Dioscorea cayenensis subsp. rotundata]
MWPSASLSLRALCCFASSSSSSLLLSPALWLSHHFLLSSLSSNPRPFPLMQSSTAEPHPFSSSPLASSSRGKGRGFGSRDDRSPHGGKGGIDRIDALGRLLTRILRHQALELKLDMRSDGYVRVHDLLMLNVMTLAKVPLRSHSVDEVKEAVRRDNKQRFGLLEENGELLIRANQGHTISIISSESLLQPILSVDELVCVHGTYKKNLESILQFGLKRMARLHVHFSCGLPTDGQIISGMRRDVNVLVFLNVRKALEEDMKLYISDNKVILTEGFNGVVPVKFFEKIETWPGRQPIPFQS